MDPIIFRNKKVLITGGQGFLGSHLVKALLEQQAKVYVLDIAAVSNQADVQYYQINLLDYTTLKNCMASIKPDIIYHLAASLNRTRDFTEAHALLNTNLNGTVNLLNVLRDVPYQKLIYVSTSEVYGGNNIKSPFKEDGSFIPASPYALSKYCAEVAIQTFSEIYLKNYTILRLFNFYGPGLPNHFFISQLIEKLKTHADFDMTKGEQKRDFLYIKDVISALLLAQSSKANQSVFNVCSGQGACIKDIALEIKNILNSASHINFGALNYRENEVWNMIGDYRKIKEALGWQPNYSLKDGMRDFFKFK
jgi:nucleoside-diphosphate-sugar epimerase